MNTGSRRISEKKTVFKWNKKTTKKKKSKKVYQYDLQGNLLKTYSSVAEVKRENNLATTSVIASCCRQEIKTAYGYKWSYTPL